MLIVFFISSLFEYPVQCLFVSPMHHKKLAYLANTTLSDSDDKMGFVGKITSCFLYFRCDDTLLKKGERANKPTQLLCEEQF